MENEIILYTDENGKTNVSVRFADEDVWVTQSPAASKLTIFLFFPVLADIERADTAGSKAGDCFNLVVGNHAWFCMKESLQFRPRNSQFAVLPVLIYLFGF